MRRDPVGAVVLLALIVFLGGMVWMTRNPDSELLEAAKEWPILGGLVEGFRDRYSSREEAGETTAHDLGRGKQQASRNDDRGSSEGSLVGSVEDSSGTIIRTVWARAGTRLHVRADLSSEAIAELGQIARLPVLEQSGDWYRVFHRQQLGWMWLPGYGRGDEPPLGSEPSPPTPLAGRRADPELLRLAIEKLRGEQWRARVGEYNLVTDESDSELVELLDTVASGVESEYRRRYGLTPVDRARETIVLYAGEPEYRRFQNSLDRVAGLPALGVVSRGLVAIFAGQRRSTEIAATLVHELAHLLNRRALGPALPPWLDEGIADDLALSAIGEDGQLDSARLSGASREIGHLRFWWGGQAAALEIQRALAAERPLQIRRLVELEWESFVDPAEPLNYPLSAFFVRFLTASDDELRQRFLGYLAEIAEGGSVTPEALLENLEASWPQLESSFGEWLPGALANLEREPLADTAAESDVSR